MIIRRICSYIAEILLFQRVEFFLRQYAAVEQFFHLFQIFQHRAEVVVCVQRRVFALFIRRREIFGDGRVAFAVQFVADNFHVRRTGKTERKQHLADDGQRQRGENVEYAV